MKIQKQNLAQLTEEATRVAGLAMSLLVVTRCPVLHEYEEVERFVGKVEELRLELGLAPVTKSELLYGAETKKEPIGFRLPQEGL